MHTINICQNAGDEEYYQWQGKRCLDTKDDHTLADVPPCIRLKSGPILSPHFGHSPCL
jgi:hypothetical protein